jgi:hypothetical protein
MELSGGTFRLQVMRCCGRSRHRAAPSARRGGRNWSSPQVHVWTVKDGKATSFWESPGDQQAEDEFWSSHG